MRQHSLGFTLIEFISVIVIISILAVAAYLNWPGYYLNLSAEAVQVAGDIRYTQMLAMSKNQRFRFVKSSASSYQILDASGNAVITSIGSTTMSLGSGISFGTFTNLPNSLIAFDSRGTPYVDTASPGTALTTTATIPLTSSSGTKTISISPETGRVTIS